MIKTTICPYCGKSVNYELDGGFVPSLETVLVADWVYHAACWDEQLKLFPPITNNSEDGQDGNGVSDHTFF